MNAAASWTAVTSGAIHRFRFGESEGSGLPNNLVPCQKRQLRLPSLGAKYAEGFSLLISLGLSMAANFEAVLKGIPVSVESHR